MNYETRSVTAVSIAAVVLVACGQQAPEEGAAASSAMSNMPNMPAASPAAAEHMAHGTVNSLDRAAGTVNLSHEAVASAGWPAMTMTFKLADASTVPELAPGQRVEFSFTTDGGGTVTRIAAAE
jgi:Cu(I)/Ag(I) efflux system membrane fusion protein